MVYYENETNTTNMINVESNQDNPKKIYRMISFSIIAAASIGILFFHVRNIYKQSILVFPIDPSNIPSNPTINQRFISGTRTSEEFTRIPIDCVNKNENTFIN